MQRNKRKIDVQIGIKETGCYGYSLEYRFLITGNHISELQDKLIKMFNQAYKGTDITFSINEFRLLMDFQYFFERYNAINSKFLAKKIGMHPTLLSQYVTGRKDPSVKQLDKIIKGIQQIGNELACISLT
jgi:predicted transcriptional regulator